MRLSQHLPTADATAALGATIARCCPVPSVVYLEGNLGSGKTTLARGFLRALGFAGRVKSPTYTLLEPYELARCEVCHLDLYRLGSAEELEFLGAREYLHERAVWLIEWPERGGRWLPPADLVVELTPRESGRQACLRAVSADWLKVFSDETGRFRAFNFEGQTVF